VLRVQKTIQQMDHIWKEVVRPYFKELLHISISVNEGYTTGNRIRKSTNTKYSGIYCLDIQSIKMSCVKRNFTASLTGYSSLYLDEYLSSMLQRTVKDFLLIISSSLWNRTLRFRNLYKFAISFIYFIFMVAFWRRVPRLAMLLINPLAYTAGCETG
jgi:hypothetical protein